jgi:hypothetical protein
MTLERYWLFAYERFYPLGGMEDFHSDHNQVIGCKVAYDQWRKRGDPTYPNAHIYDSLARRIILIRSTEDVDWRVADHETGRTR